MRRCLGVAVVGVLLALLASPQAAGAADDGTGADGNGSRTFVFRTRVAGLVADAVWTTCPAPAVGDVCTDTIVLAFDTKDRDNMLRTRAPVLRVLTFVYRIVDDEEIGSVPVAEWFARLEGARVDGDPRLERATASGTVPVPICTIFDPGSGLTCPSKLDASVTWTAAGLRERLDDHTVVRLPFRLENSWTRGWQRPATATATIDGAGPGVLVDAGLIRVDQGELVVQHPVG